ncbi:MAG: NUDIX hydrolase [Clostridia bacterium]|nr:NUDIX hydrolase [Clostridia bacterium]
MNCYEQISDNCKMLWKENFTLTDEKYTQVSGYIFNDKNELLIVKGEKFWTIPGGHPEEGETQLETLSRELMEEACVTLKDIKYLGAVEVVENGEIYYQLRYTAKVKDILEFTKEWEINERLFVKLDDLNKYITWSNGVTFKSQIISAKKVWNILD